MSLLTSGTAPNPHPELFSFAASTGTFVFSWVSNRNRAFDGSAPSHSLFVYIPKVRSAAPTQLPVNVRTGLRVIAWLQIVYFVGPVFLRNVRKLT